MSSKNRYLHLKHNQSLNLLSGSLVDLRDIFPRLKYRNTTVVQFMNKIYLQYLKIETTLWSRPFTRYSYTI